MKYLLRFATNYLAAPLVPAVLIVCGFYITAKLRVLYITKFKVIGKVLLRKDKSKKISSFRTVTVALAGTLGVGNILGVASAIKAGGSGAIFWMWIGALVSMLIKYCEVVLAVKYRKRGAGGYFGGAMYYIKSKKIALVFAALCILASLTLGNLMQMRAISETVESTFNISKVIFGALTALIIFFVICKGFKQLSSFTMLLIPFACIAYILISLYVIMENICLIPTVLSNIVKNALNIRAAASGAAGYTIMQALRYGISRGLITMKPAAVQRLWRTPKATPTVRLSRDFGEYSRFLRTQYCFAVQRRLLSLFLMTVFLPLAEWSLSSPRFQQHSGKAPAIS